MKILLTFIGDRDPDYIDKETKETIVGPILTLLSHQQYDGIELFYTPDRDHYVQRTINATKFKYPAVAVNCQPIKISDPISHREILSELRRCNAAILKKYDSADYVVHVSPGTPQMHSAWLLLTGSGEIPAKLLQTRDPKKISVGQNPIEEIDPHSNWFPHIAVVKHDLTFRPSIEPTDVEKAIAGANLIGSTETIQYITNNVAKAARSDASFLILGESGTGKEVLAQFIHRMSPRRDEAFIGIDCGAIPDTLIESELFGYKKGAHSEAKKDKPGKFKIADRGTLFLDEIGNMALPAQTKVLRAIQEGEIDPLGSTKPEAVDVRIIAATNNDLQASIKKGLFREDLYYRLNVIQIELKPLRERRQEIGILSNHFVEVLNEKEKIGKRLSPESLKLLTNYSWPGNIRELKNAIERAYIWADEETIGPEHFSLGNRIVDSAFSLPEFEDGFRLEEHLEKYRTALIEKAIQKTKNQHEAAKLLGITDAALSKRKKRP